MYAPSDFLDVNGLTFNTCVTAAIVNRRFFMTAGKRKRVAAEWEPALATRPGDLVVVLNGGLVPYILRPTGTVMTGPDGTNLSEFTIFGDYYLHGIMQGEAIDRLDAGIYPDQSFVLV